MTRAMTFDEADRETALLRSLQEQTNYSSAVLTECERLLTAIRRVDQKYGPYAEFEPWREANDLEEGSK